MEKSEDSMSQPAPLDTTPLGSNLAGDPAGEPDSGATKEKLAEEDHLLPGDKLTAPQTVVSESSTNGTQENRETDETREEIETECPTCLLFLLCGITGCCASCCLPCTILMRCIGCCLRPFQKCWRRLKGDAPPLPQQ